MVGFQWYGWGFGDVLFEISMAAWPRRTNKQYKIFSLMSVATPLCSICSKKWNHRHRLRSVELKMTDRECQRRCYCLLRLQTSKLQIYNTCFILAAMSSLFPSTQGQVKSHRPTKQSIVSPNSLISSPVERLSQWKQDCTHHECVASYTADQIWRCSAKHSAWLWLTYLWIVPWKVHE